MSLSQARVSARKCLTWQAVDLGLVALIVALALQPDPIIGRASVIDGDTLEIRGQRIRLWGVDAPEGRQSCTRAGQPYRCGTEAANALDLWIGGRTVSCDPKGRPDRYGRIVAVCRVDGQDMAAWAVSQGHAVDYATFSRGAYASEEAFARSRRFGVWSGELQMPWEWRRNRR